MHGLPIRNVQFYQMMLESFLEQVGVDLLWVIGEIVKSSLQSPLVLRWRSTEKLVRGGRHSHRLQYAPIRDSRKRQNVR